MMFLPTVQTQLAVFNVPVSQVTKATALLVEVRTKPFISCVQYILRV